MHDVAHVSCVGSVPCAGPAQPLTAAGEEVDDLDHHLSVRGVKLYFALNPHLNPNQLEMLWELSCSEALLWNIITILSTPGQVVKTTMADSISSFRSALSWTRLLSLGGARAVFSMTTSSAEPRGSRRTISK